MQVLLVEDNESTRTLLDAVLASRDHVATTCADAESALAAYSPERFPLVVLDWLLPGMDGLELCRRIRAMPGGDRSVILVITARSRPEDLRAALAAGADDYLAKPIDIDSLAVRLGVAERTVLNVARRKRAEDELSRAFAAIEKSHADLMSILDGFRAGTVLTDPKGRIHFVNRAARSILGLGDDDVTRSHWE
ncbi:MAG: response regulator, partial [Alphaproteobacteria bacterium]